MINESMAKEIGDALDKGMRDTETALKLRPVNGGKATVTGDIEALQAKLQAIVKGLQMLKEQL